MSKTEHLRTNRRLILSRALLSGAAGMLPLPYVDDLLAGSIRAALIRRIAEIRQVDVDANAVDALAHPYSNRILNAASLGAIAIGGTRRVMRKLAVSFLLVRRVDESVQTFQLGTLFDHYCAKQHVGPGLDGNRALMLRQSMEHAIRQARSEAITRAFKKGLRSLGALTMSMPRNALSLWSRLRGGPIRADKVDTFDDRLEVAASSSLMKRAVSSVENEVQSLERGYFEALLDTFDAAWQARASEHS